MLDYSRSREKISFGNSGRFLGDCSRSLKLKNSIGKYGFITMPQKICFCYNAHHSNKCLQYDREVRLKRSWWLFRTFRNFLSGTKLAFCRLREFSSRVLALEGQVGVFSQPLKYFLYLDRVTPPSRRVLGWTASRWTRTARGRRTST